MEQPSPGYDSLEEEVRELRALYDVNLECIASLVRHSFPNTIAAVKAFPDHAGAIVRACDRFDIP
jgi:hypothetical protein